MARWTELVSRPEGEVPLDEAALLISATANPGLDVPAQLSRLDDLAERVDSPDVPALCRLMFDDLGLQGDRETYDDPLNSYLDQVLDRGRGIPISLSVLLIEVGRRCGIVLEPVGMPGHFMVRDPARPDELLDAFQQGRRLDRLGCERLLQSATGKAVELTEDMLRPTGAHAVLARMLANLDRSFERRDDRKSLTWVSELRAQLPEAPLGDRMQLAARMAVLGQFDAAAGVLEDAADRADEPARMLDQAEALRARLN
jgi:regulator of sirC expression with transglutaminase-like and TPR domain